MAFLKKIQYIFFDFLGFLYIYINSLGKVTIVTSKQKQLPKKALFDQDLLICSL